MSTPDILDSFDSPPSSKQKSQVPGFIKKYLVHPPVSKFQELQENCGDRPAPFLFFTWPDAGDVLRHTENHILRENGNGQVPLDMKKQFMEDCTMLAVAAAIMAQIAITTLSLDHLEEVRWTAKASFIISLITAALSVFFTGRVQQKMTNLLSAEDVKNFLSTQIAKKYIMDIEKVARCFERLKRIEEGFKEEERNPNMAELQRLLEELDDKARWNRASLVAAMMIKVPNLLLDASISTLIIGFGIYLKDLSLDDPNRPLSGAPSWKIFVVYLVFVICGSFIYIVPWGMKRLEMTYARHWDEHKRNKNTSEIWRDELFRERQNRAVEVALKTAKELAVEIKKSHVDRRKRAKNAKVIEDIRTSIENDGTRSGRSSEDVSTLG